MEESINTGMSAEMQAHPWLDEKTARRLAEDNLRGDPEYYGAEEEPSEKKDPFPEEGTPSEGEERKPSPERGKGPALVIEFGGPKEKKDPFPEE